MAKTPSAEEIAAARINVQAAQLRLYAVFRDVESQQTACGIAERRRQAISHFDDEATVLWNRDRLGLTRHHQRRGPPHIAAEACDLGLRDAGSQ